MTYYEILEVSEGAGFAEIRNSYRRLVKLYHPDLNPSAIAKERIVQITGAYECLSDPIKKSQYDMLLRGTEESQPSFTSEPAPRYQDERDLRRKEYIKRKRAQEQHNWEQLFRIKVKFYKAQRYFAFVFLVVSLVYTWDYYDLEEKGAYHVKRMGLNKYGQCGVELSNHVGFTTDEAFFYDVGPLENPKVKVYYSVLHQVPVALSVKNGGYYKINNTVHSFHNFFGFLLGFLGLLLILNQQYSDWRLTLGLLPFFIMFFLFLLTYNTRMGIY